MRRHGARSFPRAGGRHGGGPPPPSRSHAEIEREELSRLFGRLVAVRVLALPVALALVGALLWTDPSPWRRAVLAASAAAITAFFLLELARYRSRGIGPAALSRNVAGATAGQLVVAFASGGIESPFLSAAVPIGLLAALFMGPRARVLLPLLQIGAVVAMAALAATAAIPDLNLAAFGGGARLGDGTAHVWADAVMLSLVLAGTHLVGRALRTAFEAIVERQLAAQEDALRLHRERAEELTALSGEIAHELKNPLASVKGLAGLLAPALADPKALERLAVLRREVDRTQAILDEFLNFSRPLVPLALGECDLGALCRGVAALHEAAAKERGVALAAPAGEVLVRCDPRKVTQVLVNLVGNALDASPPGAEIALEAAPLAGGGARVRVLDRGEGVQAEHVDALFLPGFTTKPGGSGLGLTIARAIARQHGGELALAPRPGGGAVAEVTLPGAGLRVGMASPVLAGR